MKRRLLANAAAVVLLPLFVAGAHGQPRPAGEMICNAQRLAGGAQLIAGTPDFGPNCYKQALQMIKRARRVDSNLSEAQGILRTLVEIVPESSYAWVGLVALGLRRYEIGDSSVSLHGLLEEAHRAESTRPRVPELQVLIGRIELRLRCLPCAERSARRALAVWPNHADTLAFNAEIVALRGDAAETERLYMDAVKAAESREEKADLYARLGEYFALHANFKAADWAFAQGIREDPVSSAPILRQASYLLFWKGDGDAASGAAQQAGQKTASPEVRQVQWLARLLVAARQPEAAAWAKTWQRSPISPEEALVLASEHKSLLPLTRALLKTKAARDLQSRDGEGNTPLLLACRGGNLEAVRLLLVQGADSNVSNSRGETPLMYAAGHGDPGIVEALVRSGAKTGALDNEGNSVLSIAIFSAKPGVARILIDGRGKRQGGGRWQDSDLLVRAAWNGDAESVKALIQHGAKVNSQDRNGLSPLHAAVMSNSRDVAKILLENGADPRQKHNGTTAADLAREQGNQDMFKLIETHVRRPI